MLAEEAEQAMQAQIVLLSSELAKVGGVYQMG
jgi:hypothetical protein